MMLANAFQANLGMMIMRRTNAVVKASVGLLIIPLMWVFQLTVNDLGEIQTTPSLKVVGIFIMVAGLVWYIAADNDMENQIRASGVGRINRLKENILQQKDDENLALLDEQIVEDNRDSGKSSSRPGTIIVGTED